MFCEMEFVVRDPVTDAEFINRAKFPILAAIEPPDKQRKKPKKQEQPAQTISPNKQARLGFGFPEV